MKMFKANTYTLIKAFFLSGIMLLIAGQIQAQQASQQLGNAVLGAFRAGSVDSLVSLQMTYDDVLALAHETGLDADTARMSAFRKSYPSVIEQYRQYYQQMMDQGMEQKSDWRKATPDSITTREEELSVREIQKITLMTIFFHVDGKAYRLVADIHLRNGKLKLGSNIDLFNDSMKE